MRHFGAARNRVGIGAGLYKRIQSAVPKMVGVPVPLEEKFISDMVARAGAGGGIGTVLPLQIRVQLLVDYRHFHLVLHNSHLCKIGVLSTCRQ